MTIFTKVPRAVEDQLQAWNASTSRRAFLKTSGRLVVSVGALAAAGTLFGASDAGATQQSATAGPYPDPDYLQLDSWVVIHEDSTATFFLGKTDLGQGTGTAFRQLMCDELDLAYDKSELRMGSTHNTVDQGGSGGSDALQVDSWPARRVAAEARRVLLELAAVRFGVPVDQLGVSEGVIAVKGDVTRRVAYGELVGGKRFNVTLTNSAPPPAGSRNNTIDLTTGLAKVKAVQEFQIVGTSPRRYDIPAKVDASLTYAVDVKLPGMLHARNVKPAQAGATLASIDESSIKGLPGVVKVVSKGNYVAVVCEREEQAIAAATQLKTIWTKPAVSPFPTHESLFTYIRAATPTSTTEPIVVGDPDAAMRGAATVVEAEYHYPFQGHNCMGPAHAVADPSNGQMTIYCNDMKPYLLRAGVSKFLQIPYESVRVIWMDGPQGYGRTAAGDAGYEAAFLAKELGRPVRVQWMRREEAAWDTKGPAFLFTLRGGLDHGGNVVAHDYEARAVDYGHLGYNEPDTVLIAQFTGVRRATPASGKADKPGDMYAIANRRTSMHVVRLPLVWESPIRMGNLRDPNGPQVTFAGESFIDELAAAAKADPVDFRLRLLNAGSGDDEEFKRARSIAVIKAAAGAYKWDSRPSPKPSETGDVRRGRGFAYGYRDETVVATVAEIEVNVKTGRVWVRRLLCAHDCGLVVNPQGLLHTVEGAMMFGLSKALFEEVTFDAEKVTNVDWRTYPILTHNDVPEALEVVVVNGDPNPDRPDLPPYGAGEAASRTVPAAVANAIFDATGVRIRRVPLRRERVLSALEAANKAAATGG